MIFEPTSLPFKWICWPLALPGKRDLADTGDEERVDEAEQDREDDDAITDVRMSRRMSVEVSCQSLDDRTEQQSREEGERADEDDHADQQDHERWVVGAHRAEAGRADTLARQGSCDRQREEDRRVAREDHVEAAEQVGECDPVSAEIACVRLDVACVAGERGAVVVGL